jgi:hypothetical protein
MFDSTGSHAAADPVVAIIAKIGHFRGDSRFTNRA